MPNFKRRTTEPGWNNREYRHVSSDGLNECILIDDGMAIPNCVGYMWGRWYELLGERPRLSMGHAFRAWSHNDGYARSQSPKLGSVMCWSGGWGDYGHVAIVEVVHADGSVTCSNSAYGGSTFYERRLYPPFNFGAYSFSGFIHTPVNFTEGNRGGKSNETVAQEVINGQWGDGEDRKEALRQNGYDPQIIQSLVNSMLEQAPSSKSDAEVAKEVILGEWGNGEERRERLKAAGYNPDHIQNLVNDQLDDLDEIAYQVIRGEWGNGPERRTRLINAGHDYYKVQDRVNELS